MSATTIYEKRDAEIFRRRLTTLRQRTRLGARRWWPYFLYHFADLQNVASILKNDVLLSRAGVMTAYEGFTDSASPDVIDQTEEKWKHFVRFYFRPRTPTLYRNEGFRPVKRRVLGGAHCPMPVYLFFDFEELICREDAAFSYGSLARPDTLVYDTGDAFEKLPFDLVYHDSRFEKEERDSIIFHRHAEVVIRDQINLNSLRYIWCRSEAEYETLRFLLPPAVRQRWEGRIGIRSDYSLFNREWVYVDRALLGADSLVFYFNPSRSSLDAGPFDLRVKVVDEQTGKQYNYRDPNAEIGQPLVVDLAEMGAVEHYTVTLFLDGTIAYASSYQAEPLPF